MAYKFSRVENLLIIEDDSTGASVPVLRTAQPCYVFVEANEIGVRVGGTWVVKATLEEITSIDGQPPAATLAECAAQFDAILPGNYTIAYTQLAAPTGLSATPGDTVATLDWTNAANADATQIQVATDDTYTTGLQEFTVADPTVTKALTGLTNGTEYFWRIRNTATNYLRSEWVEGTPFTPTAP